MSRPSWLQKMYWSYLGKPTEERALFKVLLNRPVSSVLEIGVGNGTRTRRIARLLGLTCGAEAVRYIGTDEFESAQDSQKHLSLKQAHQLVGALGFEKASLIPGDVVAALPRVAHKFGASDLVIVDGGLDPSSPATSSVFGWLNRIAHDGSIVVACQKSGGELVEIDHRYQDEGKFAA